jgi:hypothetical protein
MDDKIKFAWDPKKHDENAPAAPKVLALRCPKCKNAFFAQARPMALVIDKDFKNFAWGQPMALCLECNTAFKPEELEIAGERPNIKAVKDPQKPPA